MGTVNAGPALPFQPLKYLKCYFTIPVQKVAHLLTPVLRQRREEQSKVDLVRVAGYSHRQYLTAMVLFSKVALPA
jgi:hypothetical protein